MRLLRWLALFLPLLGFSAESVAVATLRQATNVVKKPNLLQRRHSAGSGSAHSRGRWPEDQDHKWGYRSSAEDLSSGQAVRADTEPVLAPAHVEETSSGEAQPGKPSDFFYEDAQQMGEMPPYVDPGGANKTSLMCQPQCNYKCGPTKTCDQACEPRCAPPKCQTTCKKDANKCATRCSEPRCAVVCPSSECPDRNCPKCRTVCAAPQCTTQCSEDCHTTCDKPSCTWSCQAGDCPKPSCMMSCTGLGRCPFAEQLAGLRSGTPDMPDKKIVGEKVASLDPSTLYVADTAPVPWMVDRQATTLPPSAPPKPCDGPVGCLKMRWNHEDAAKKKWDEDRKQDEAPEYDVHEAGVERRVRW